MIVAGHKNGPLAPTPITTNCLLCSENPVAFDNAIVRIMGFNKEYLPVLNRITQAKGYILCNENIDIMKIFSNDSKINEKRILDIPKGLYGKFKPSDGWNIIV